MTLRYLDGVVDPLPVSRMFTPDALPVEDTANELTFDVGSVKLDAPETESVVKLPELPEIGVLLMEPPVICAFAVLKTPVVAVPETVKLPKVPNEVIFGCAAVCSVPVMPAEAAKVVKLPVDPLIGVPLIAPPVTWALLVIKLPVLVNPVTVRFARVPRLVMLGCAAVCSVPVMPLDAERVVKLPDAPLIGVLLMLPPVICAFAVTRLAIVANLFTVSVFVVMLSALIGPVTMTLAKVGAAKTPDT